MRRAYAHAMTADTPNPEPERDRDLDALEDAELALAALESELESIDGTPRDEARTDDGGDS
jgi:hypothetical protein